MNNKQKQLYRKWFFHDLGFVNKLEQDELNKYNTARSLNNNLLVENLDKSDNTESYGVLHILKAHLYRLEKMSPFYNALVNTFYNELQ